MRVFRAVAVGWLLHACATTPVAASADRVSGPVSAALASARQRRDDAAAIAPPALASGASPTDVVAFMKDSVASWLKARRAAVDACTDAYRKAANEAAPADSAATMLEASLAATAFLDAYAKLSDDVASALATDSDTKTELLAAFRESGLPHVDMAKALLGECIGADQRSSAADECGKMLERLGGTTGAH